MATGNLIKKKEEFELWLKSQIAKGCDLLKREVSEDDTTIVRYRTIVKIKEYDEDRKNSQKNGKIWINKVSVWY